MHKTINPLPSKQTVEGSNPSAITYRVQTKTKPCISY